MSNQDNEKDRQPVWRPLGSVRRRIARKPHVCVECGEKILPGEEYIREVGIWDGHGFVGSNRLEEINQHVECPDLDALRGLNEDEESGRIQSEAMLDMTDTIMGA